MQILKSNRTNYANCPMNENLKAGSVFCCQCLFHEVRPFEYEFNAYGYMINQDDIYLNCYHGDERYFELLELTGNKAKTLEILKEERKDA